MDATASPKPRSLSNCPGRPRQTAIGRVLACGLTYRIPRGRKETALICLRALLEQTWPVDEILVSKTSALRMEPKEFLEQAGFLARANLTFLRIENNRGPAGGFAALFEYAFSRGCAWVWAMDDDVIPEPNALDELMRATTAQTFPRRTMSAFL